MGRETEQDKKNEAVILQYIAAHFGCEFQQIPTHSEKWNKIDGWLHSGRKCLGLVECKWLEKESMYGINLPKYVEIVQLARLGDVPAYYGVRVPGKIGYIELFNVWESADAKLECSGGTPPGREPRWDDREPMMMFDKEQIKWIKER